MENIFKLEIISPENIIYSDNVSMVTLPSYEGNMSILKNHISIITFLRPGIIRAQKKNEGEYSDFFVEDGTVEYFKDSLVVLSPSALNVKSISRDIISNLTKDTEEKLSKKDLSDHESYVLNHKLDALKQIKI
tara:strand:- start:270 stop:668 length:399 start_codon:yes stop_codon:yes gene_type:complete